ncbi:hypothetical protein SAMN05216371_7039 [Streptomyces sp. TLI_053]|uniref:hypothetical protein n=1 Tax=Streptomyces sp. TLI_053 TaxID=1855352 RepID=UPI00087C9204|nr:hypothetical protein [Streptomyces sp. TLI_053]SDT82227.1 hypothetical protein SAMN05216371_7039 [Streptomyces sp. TLI_053]
MDAAGLAAWGTRVAVIAAPDERDLAPSITLAYAAGGRARRDLYRRAGHTPGGIGGGLVTVLPQLLDALAYAAREVGDVLGSAQFGNLVSATALLVSLRRRSDRSDTGAPPGPDPGAHPGSGGGAGEPTETALHAAARLGARLRSRGVPPPDADRLACELLAGLLNSPDRRDAAAFLDRLVAAEPPEPAVRPRRRPFGRRRRTRATDPPPAPEPGADDRSGSVGTEDREDTP